jgi:hypothetical protein
MSWIDINEEMPPNDKFILACHRAHGICLGYRWEELNQELKQHKKRPCEYLWDFVKTRKEPLKEGFDWWEEPFIAKDNQVSHWMELPDMPKEEEDGSEDIL